jgi:hypothetical protein
MQHAPLGGADAAAAAATVAPLLQLKRAAQKAEKLARLSRAVELYRRAVAAAELALPHDSPVIASLLTELLIVQLKVAQGTPNDVAVAERAELQLRLLHLLHAHWKAGTLFAPTAEEVAYFAQNEYPWLPAQMCGTFFYISAAANMGEKLRYLPASTSSLDADAWLPGLYGALRTALETDVRGMLERDPRTGQAWSASSAEIRWSCL